MQKMEFLPSFKNIPVNLQNICICFKISKLLLVLKLIYRGQMEVENQTNNLNTLTFSPDVWQKTTTKKLLMAFTVILVIVLKNH